MTRTIAGGTSRRAALHRRVGTNEAFSRNSPHPTRHNTSNSTSNGTSNSISHNTSKIPGASRSSRVSSSLRISTRPRVSRCLSSSFRRRPVASHRRRSARDHSSSPSNSHRTVHSSPHSTQHSNSPESSRRVGDSKGPRHSKGPRYSREARSSRDPDLIRGREAPHSNGPPNGEVRAAHSTSNSPVERPRGRPRSTHNST